MNLSKVLNIRSRSVRTATKSATLERFSLFGVGVNGRSILLLVFLCVKVHSGKTFRNTH